jgi:probable HAF family extracellular repeat protein
MLKPRGLAGFAVIASLAIVAPAQADPRYPYTLTDLGTLGGPQDSVANSNYINDRGLVSGAADTARLAPADENPGFNGDPYVQHAYLWRNGHLIDLSALGANPADNSSFSNGVNARGDVAGGSDTGAVDPLSGVTAGDPVLWKDGRIIDLGTLGGYQGAANDLDNRDDVVGWTTNAVPDPFSLTGTGAQNRAFLWRDGRMRDLGTLGGPDSFGWFINDHGQVAGVSYTDATPKPTTGQPQVDAFLWEHGRMRDLGSLGGSLPLDGVRAIADNGDVIGHSLIAGDQQDHPFLWDGHHMIDLGTLGGDNGTASWINRHGVVTGTADLPDQTHRAFVWQHGTMTGLPPLPGAQCSNGGIVTDSGELLGNSTDCHGNATAVIWNDGSPTALNTLAAPSPLHMTDVEGINRAGQIIGEAKTPDGNTHDFLLTPTRH